jgi:hypothetical protein
MKSCTTSRTFIFLLLLAISGIAGAQINQVNIVNFTVRNTLPGNIDSWLSTPGALLLTAQKVQSARINEPRLVIQIKSNGALICGNTPATANPIDPFDVRTFNTADLTGPLHNCKELKEGNYTICAQFFNVDRKAISQEVCKEFKVEATNVDYAPPALITPANSKKFTLPQLMQPIVFRWTPVIPKPKEAVTYRLRVWQLMEGQNGVQAMRANQPLVTKNIENNTQATVTNLLTGPCKPPYLCDFIWSVQALGRNGKPIGSNNGNSEAYSFKMSNDIDIQIDSVSVTCCKDGIQNFVIIIKNNLSNTVKITQLKIDKVNGYTNNPAISGLAPTLPINIAGNGSQTFTGSIKCIDTAKTIRFYVAAEDAVDNAITETEVETDTLQCACDPCRTLGVEIKNDKLTIISNSSNEITLSGTLSGLDPNKVKKITMELVYFNITQTGDSNCAKCAQNKEWGNFIPPASYSFNGFGNPVLNGGNFGRLWTWISTSEKVCNDGTTGGGHNGENKLACDNCGTMPSPNNKNIAPEQNQNANIIIQPGTGIPKGNGFSLPIALPPGSSLSCCGDKIQVCIRYTWWDFCCHACDVIKCYEIERKPAK